MSLRHIVYKLWLLVEHWKLLAAGKPTPAKWVTLVSDVHMLLDTVAIDAHRWSQRVLVPVPSVACLSLSGRRGWQHFYDFIVGVVGKQFHNLYQQSVSGGCRHKPGGEIKVDQRPSSGYLSGSKQFWQYVRQSASTLSKPQIKQCVTALFVFVYCIL